MRSEVKIEMYSICIFKVRVILDKEQMRLACCSVVGGWQRSK